MRLAIMQPYLFPYIGYFQLIKAVDKFILFDDVNYIKKGWINRNRILINGREFMFTIPLEKVSQNKMINEINLANDNGWKNKLLETFDAAFRKAPMYSDVFPILKEVIGVRERNLSVFIGNSIVQICNYLDIVSILELSSLKYNTTHLKGQDKILNICIQEEADTYLNSVGGAGLYSKKAFEELNINLKFLKPKLVIYPRLKVDSVPSLSIIDVMMFNEKDRVKSYLLEYELL
jgi:hypothetical protein